MGRTSAPMSKGFPGLGSKRCIARLVIALTALIRVRRANLERILRVKPSAQEGQWQRGDVC